jgi:uncharacterized protein (TIGR00255 family)
MTGYGRASTSGRGDEDGWKDPGTAGLPAWVVEVRSVNHRALDLKIRGPEPDAFCEMEVTRLVRASMERGAITVTLSREIASVGESALDPDRIRRLHASLEVVRHGLGLTAPVDLATVAAFLGLEMAQEGPSRTGPRGEALWAILAPAVEKAMLGLAETREREGRALKADLTSRLSRLSVIVSGIEAELVSAPDRFTRRLHEKLAALRDLPGFEPGRLAQEVAVLADRLDVSEEVVRLRTHLAHLVALLESAGPVGRKLDFVLQEIGREINTLGSKAQDASVAGLVIEAKSELEKIREQAQNIE